MGSPLAAFSELDRRPITRLLAALALVSLVGVGIDATILYLHGQIDRLGDAYTSFCSVNDSINCDRVLASSYSKLAGLPVAWFALAAYLGLTGLFAAAARSGDDARRSRLLALGAVGVIGSLVFSGYMAVISVFRLETLCLMCMGLYAVALTNSGLTLAALRATSRLTGSSPLGLLPATGVLAAGVAAVTALAVFTWPSPTAQLASNIQSAADVKEAAPEFYEWYMALPKVPPRSLIRDEQAGLVGQGKVVIVDFFDVECGHCKKNHRLVTELAVRRGDQIEVVHRHFPLDASCNDIVPASIHPNACRAAEAVECGGLQGKADEMLEILFKNQGQLWAENLVRLGGKIGLDQEALRKCLDEHTTLPTVLADARAGAKLDITSTPTVFVGGRRVKGVLEEVDKYEMAVLIEASPPPAP